MSILWPELPVDPPEEKYITADCGCEVYDGENIYTWECKRLCPDCMKQKIAEMRLEELAALLGCTWREVRIK